MGSSTKRPTVPWRALIAAFVDLAKFIVRRLTEQ